MSKMKPIDASQVDMSFTLEEVSLYENSESRTADILNDIRATSERLAREHGNPVYNREKAEAYVGTVTPETKLNSITLVTSNQLVRNARRMLSRGEAPSLGKISTKGDSEYPVAELSPRPATAEDSRFDMTFTLEETEAKAPVDVIAEVVSWNDLEGPVAGLAAYLDPDRKSVFLPGVPGVKVNYRYARDLSSAEAGTELQGQVVEVQPMEVAIAGIFHKLGI